MTIANQARPDTHLRSTATGAPHDPGLFAPLTDDEQMVLRHVLAGGWYMIRAAKATRPPLNARMTCSCPDHVCTDPDGSRLWWDLCDLLTDLHLCWEIDQAQAAPHIVAAFTRKEVTR